MAFGCRLLALWGELGVVSFNSTHIQRFHSLPLRFVPCVAIPLHHLSRHMARKRHDRVVCGPTIRKPGNEGVAEVVQPALNPRQLPASSPRDFPTPYRLFGIAVPHTDGSTLVPLLSIEAVTLGRENKVRGKGFLKALPPLDERGKSLMVERD